MQLLNFFQHSLKTIPLKKKKKFFFKKKKKNEKKSQVNLRSIKRGFIGLFPTIQQLFAGNQGLFRP